MKLITPWRLITMKRIIPPKCVVCHSVLDNGTFQVEQGDCVLPRRYWTSGDIEPINPGDYLCYGCRMRAETHWVNETTLMEELIKGVGYKWCSMEVEELFKKKMAGGSKL